ncbi:MAG TPA: hypothetical protein VMU20_14035 [Candidatus Dormibacteraeota bacterium]|jgi:hypothetical protein|nr:hypothetical protein [Candidatus Dormibacteraeota bacterium]
MSGVPDTRELRRAGLGALGWSALLWLPAGLLVAVGVVATGRIGSGYPEAIAGFIVDEAGVGYCFVIMAIACGVGYPIAQARHPVLPAGLVESQIFAVIVYAAMLVVSLPLQALLLQGMGLHPDRAVLAAIVVPPKVAAAVVAASTVYPWYLTRRERVGDPPA